MSTSTTATTTRARRLAAIVANAQVRMVLGQSAQHELLADGRHRVRFYDRTAGRLLTGDGTTVAQAITNLREVNGNE